VIEARGVGVHHRHGPPILTGVDLDLLPGERLLLLGRSGAGKSSLALVLGGLVPPRAGTVMINGLPADHRRSRREIAGQVGFVFQSPETQLVTSRVADEIAFGLENLGWPRGRIQARVAALLDALALEPLAERAPRTLSGGEMQRVALAAALAPGSPYLILDEPFAHLDEQSAVQMEEAILAMTRASDVMRLDLAPYPACQGPAMAQRLILIDGGRIAHQGPGKLPADLALRLLGEDEPEVSQPLGPLSPGPAPAALRARGLAGGWGKRDGGSHRPGERHGAHDEVQVVFRGIDLDLRPGAVAHVEGRSGAGKSTLLLTLAGLIPPLAGAVEVEPRAPLRDRVSCVLQFAERLFYRSSVREELVEYGRHGGEEEGSPARMGQVLERALDLVQLPPAVLDRPPLKLSSGEVRRLALASGLVSRRPVLLLDEPAQGLDGPGRRMLKRLIRSFAAHRGTVVIASHDVELKELADERWLLAEGCLSREVGPAKS
jgi:energy-coupling factor transport system ATP-binding protein